MTGAIAVFDGKVKGTVTFTEVGKNICVSLDLSGLKPNALHGFHVHECGDLSKGCESMCAHFNPYGKLHGGPNSAERHVGDLGNIYSDNQGRARYSFRDNLIKVRGSQCNIIGRGLIIHADPDDLGKGCNQLSSITGNSGKRMACAVIGHKST
jgi:Cu-Zn family superoxide dismutase